MRAFGMGGVRRFVWGELVAPKRAACARIIATADQASLIRFIVRYAAIGSPSVALSRGNAIPS